MYTLRYLQLSRFNNGDNGAKKSWTKMQNKFFLSISLAECEKSRWMEIESANDRMNTILKSSNMQVVG